MLEEVPTIFLPKPLEVKKDERLTVDFDRTGQVS